MKHQYGIKFSKVVLSLALLFAVFIPEINAQQTSFSKPGKSKVYILDGNSWIHARNTIHTYNAAGQEIEKLYQDAVANKVFGKTVLKYDSIGDIKSLCNFDWVNGNWHLHDGSRDSLVYKGNRLTTNYFSIWNGGGWNNEKIEYIYDANGFLIQEDFYVEAYINSGWGNNGKTHYTNDANGVRTQKQNYRFFDNKWELTYTENYEAWHIPNVLPAVYTSVSAVYTSSSWRTRIKLGDYGSKTILEEGFNEVDSTWTPTFRQIFTNDFQGNFINSKAEIYDNTNGLWETTSESGERITYNPYFKIMEKVEYWNEANIKPLIIKDRLKTVYGNFQYFGEVPEKVIIAYPNPTGGIINFSLEQEEEKLDVIVFDLSGKARLTRSFSALDSKKLNVSNLPKGIYLLQLQTETGSTTKQIVKQ